jgi:hypothetical protein
MRDEADTRPGLTHRYSYRTDREAAGIDRSGSSGRPSRTRALPRFPLRFLWRFIGTPSVFKIKLRRLLKNS